MWQGLREEAVTPEPGSPHRILDRLRLTFDLDQDVHRRIPLDADRRAAEAILRDFAVDPHHDFVPQPLEDETGGLRLRHLHLMLLAMLVAVAHASWSLPPQNSKRGTVIRLVDAQAQDFVPFFQLAATVVSPVDHLAAKDELGTGLDDRRFERRGIVHARFQLELVARLGGGHANRAARTAWVSPRFSNTCVAPAARSAAVS